MKISFAVETEAEGSLLLKSTWTVSASLGCLVLYTYTEDASIHSSQNHKLKTCKNIDNIVLECTFLKLYWVLTTATTTRVLTTATTIGIVRVPALLLASTPGCQL